LKVSQSNGCDTRLTPSLQAVADRIGGKGALKRTNFPGDFPSQHRPC
jgi:hypothetical protein